MIERQKIHVNAVYVTAWSVAIRCDGFAEWQRNEI